VHDLAAGPRTQVAPEPFSEIVGPAPQTGPGARFSFRVRGETRGLFLDSAGIRFQLGFEGPGGGNEAGRFEGFVGQPDQAAEFPAQEKSGDVGFSESQPDVHGAARSSFFRLL